jgi:hypothetical protein
MGAEEAPVRTERAWFLSYFPRWGNQRAYDPPSLTPITKIRMLTFRLDSLTFQAANDMILLNFRAYKYFEP